MILRDYNIPKRFFEWVNNAEGVKERGIFFSHKYYPNEAIATIISYGEENCIQ